MGKPYCCLSFLLGICCKYPLDRDLTRIFKIAVQDSSFMKSCSPRQNFAVPAYKHEYLSLIFVNRKKWIFIIVLYCGGTALHTLLLY